MAKVFISHSWNDNEISRKIAHELKKDGAEIWIDYARIKPDEGLPDRIGEAFEGVIHWYWFGRNLLLNLIRSN